MEGVDILPIDTEDKSLNGTHKAPSANNCVNEATAKAANEAVNHKNTETVCQAGDTKDTEDDSSQEYVYLYNSTSPDLPMKVESNSQPATCSNNNNKVEAPKANSNKAEIDSSVSVKVEDVQLDVDGVKSTVTVDVQIHQNSVSTTGSSNQCDSIKSTVCIANVSDLKSVSVTCNNTCAVGCSGSVPMTTPGDTSDSTLLVNKSENDRTSVNECRNESCDKNGCDNLDQIKQDVKPDYGGARPKLQIQPRRVQYQKHEMLQCKRGDDGLTELEAYLHERQISGMRRHSKDSDVSPILSHSDLMHKRRSLPFVPRTSQYEKHSLLQEKTESGHNELELFLMEKEQSCAAAADKRAQFRKGYSLQEDLIGATNTAVCSSNSPPTHAKKLVPRGATFERHHLLKKTASGLSELEMLLLDKEREIEERRRSLDCVGGATGFNQKLLPRTEQYEKNVLLETITTGGGLLLDEVLSETVSNKDKESLLDPNSSVKQKRSSGGSVRRVHFDPSSVCEESDGEQRDESDRLLEHPSTDSSASTTSSTARRKKSGMGRNKLSTGLSVDKSPETSHSSVGDAQTIKMTTNTQSTPDSTLTKGCCVLS